MDCQPTWIVLTWAFLVIVQRPATCQKVACLSEGFARTQFRQLSAHWPCGHNKGTCYCQPNESTDIDLAHVIPSSIGGGPSCQV